MTFLDVLDYSEYSESKKNLEKFFFHENIASSVRKQNQYLIQNRHVLLVHQEIRSENI